MTNFRGMALYANIKSRFRLTLNLLAVGATTAMNYYDETGNTTLGSPVISSIGDTSGMATGQLVTGTGIPAGARILTVDSATQITLDDNATANGTGVAIRARDRFSIDGVDFWANDSEVIATQFFLASTGSTAAENIAATARSLIRVINRQTSGGIYAFYLSGYQDLPGQILFEDRAFGGAAWAVTCTKGQSWSQELQESGTSVQSSAEERLNGVAISKNLQPEAVPLGNRVYPGSADKRIRRIIAGRDSVFVLKEDGIFRITGDTPETIVVTPFDDTAKLKGDETAVKLNNQIFGYFDQGVCAVSESGVQVVSRDIEKSLLQIFSSLYTNASTAAFGVGYESERKYFLWTVSSVGDTSAKQAWVYNTFTSSWTRWERDVECGFVNPTDDKLYMGFSTTNQIKQERKTYTVEDYAEDEYSLTITAFSGLVVTVDSTSDAAVGQTLAQASGLVYSQAIVIEVIDGTNLRVDREVQWTLAAAKLYDAIDVEIEFAPIHGGQPGMVKHFTEVAIFFREARFRSIDLLVASNFSFAGSAIPLQPTITGAWGLAPWGTFPWGGGPPPVQAIRTFIPMEQQRANWINMSIEHSEALTELAIAGHSNPLDASGTRWS
jgi:hypothetical protein